MGVVVCEMLLPLGAGSSVWGVHPFAPALPRNQLALPVPRCQGMVVAELATGERLVDLWRRALGRRVPLARAGGRRRRRDDAALLGWGGRGGGSGREGSAHRAPVGNEEGHGGRLPTLLESVGWRPDLAALGLAPAVDPATLLGGLAGSPEGAGTAPTAAGGDGLGALLDGCWATTPRERPAAAAVQAALTALGGGSPGAGALASPPCSWEHPAAGNELASAQRSSLLPLEKPLKEPCPPSEGRSDGGSSLRSLEAGSAGARGLFSSFQERPPAAVPSLGGGSEVVASQPLPLPEGGGGNSKDDDDDDEPPYIDVAALLPEMRPQLPPVQQAMLTEDHALQFSGAWGKWFA